MVYITGDTHGNQRQWVQQIRPLLSPADTLIVCGDFGVGFWNGRYWSEETFYDMLEQQGTTILFLDGNHEDFHRLSRYPVESWQGGRVHKLRPNVIHLMRGEVYTIGGQTVFVMGGGYSTDKQMRTPGESWWPEEMPSPAEYQNALAHLEAVHFQVDTILTHTAPTQTVAYIASQGLLRPTHVAPEERELTDFLDEVQRRTRYRRWYFGHFHVDTYLWRDQTCLYGYIRELESGRTVGERDIQLK